MLGISGYFDIDVDKIHRSETLNKNIMPKSRKIQFYILLASSLLW